MTTKSKKIKRTKRIRYKLKLKNNLRLSLFRSNNHIYAQLIDDENHLTLICASSAEKKLRDMKLSPKEIAFKVGEIMGDRISEKKINKKISFDRGPYLYHGRVEELAKGVRSKGIKF
jgi:large subunit ribosomal protein L18|tara:strand:+ start:40 stop:390 length:351 start_codon:yes stop_codon:yes gene_type:complete